MTFQALERKQGKGESLYKCSEIYMYITEHMCTQTISFYLYCCVVFLFLLCADNFYGDCRGIRVFYYDQSALHNSSLPNSGTEFHFASDHSSGHTDRWYRRIAKIANEQKCSCIVEAGVVVDCQRKDQDVLLKVKWDCGIIKVYSYARGDLENIRVFDMGPTGTCIFCVL